MESFSETRSTARLTVSVRRSAQGDKVRAYICRKCPRAAPRGMTRKKRTPLFRRLRRHLPPRGKARTDVCAPLQNARARAPRRAGWRRTPYRSINTRKRQNRAFAFFTLQRGAARGKVNVPRIYKRRAPNRTAQRKTPRLAVRRPAGLSSNHEFLFHQLETKFVNPFIYSSQ